MTPSQLTNSGITWNCQKLMPGRSKWSVVTKSEHTKLGVRADAAQMPTCCRGWNLAGCSLTPVSSTGQGGEMRWKSLWVKTKDEWSLTKPDSMWGKINLLPIKTDLDSQKQRQKLKHLPTSLPPLFPDPASLLHLQLFFPEQRRGTRNGVLRSVHNSSSLCCCFLLMLFPASDSGLFTGVSPSG